MAVAEERPAAAEACCILVEACTSASAVVDNSSPVVVDTVGRTCQAVGKPVHESHAPGCLTVACQPVVLVVDTGSPAEDSKAPAAAGAHTLVARADVQEAGRGKAVDLLMAGELVAAQPATRCQ